MKTLLIVEDEADIMALLKAVLEPHFDVIEAGDGLRALEMAQNYQPDLILINVLLPQMGGIEAVRRLKALERTRNIPIVFVSSRTSQEDIRRGYEAGAVDYIEKPFDIFELPGRLKRALK